MKRFVFAVTIAAILGVSVGVVQAQVVCSIPCPIWDPLAIAKSTILEETQKVINDVMQLENESLFIMNRRLSTWTSLSHYFISRDDTPDFKIFDYWTGAIVFAKSFHHALSYGDPLGVAYESITIPRVSSTVALSDMSSEESGAADYLRHQLATLDLADSAIIRATNTSGSLRFAGRDEDDAIAALQGVVLRETDDGMTATADKLAAQSLVDARNAQIQLQLHTAMIELLEIDSKRERDAEASMLNGTMNQLRDNGEISRSFMQGSGAVLRRFSLQ